MGVRRELTQAELDAVARAMQEHAMPAWYRDEVTAMLDTPEEAWPPCCGGACDPCIVSVARVVARARAILDRV